MTKKILFLIVCLAISNFYSCSKEKDDNNATTTKNEFERTFGFDNYDDAVEAILVDNSLFVIGTSESIAGGSSKMLLMNLTLNGEIKFIKTIGLNSTADQGVGIIQLKDGNVMLIGLRREIASSFNDILVVKVDVDGNVLWERLYGGTMNDIPSDIIETSEGEICIVGGTSSYGKGGGDIYLLWIDQQGNVLRELTYGDTDLDGSAEVMELEDQSLILFAYTNNYRAVDRDYYLMKLNANGDSIWAKRYGGDGYEESQEIIKTKDNSFLMIGHSSSVDPLHSMYAVKTDLDGNIIWEKHFGGVKHDGGQSLIENSFGNYVFIARSDSYGKGGESIYMITTNSSGDVIEEKSFGGSNDDRADDIIEFNSYYYLIGRSSSFGNGHFDAYIIKSQL